MVQLDSIVIDFTKHIDPWTQALNMGAEVLVIVYGAANTNNYEAITSQGAIDATLTMLNIFMKKKIVYWYLQQSIMLPIKPMVALKGFPCIHPP